MIIFEFIGVTKFVERKTKVENLRHHSFLIAKKKSQKIDLVINDGTEYVKTRQASEIPLNFQTTTNEVKEEETQKVDIEIQNLGLDRKNFTGVTIKDLQKLTEENYFKYDRRSFKEYLKDTLINEHPILGIFFFRSLLEPLPLRLGHFFFSISIELVLNAIFYTDDYIEKQATSTLAGEDEPFLTSDDLPKSIFSLIITMVIEFIILRIITIPEDVEDEFSDSLKSEDEEIIKEAYIQFKEKMKIRYIFYGLITVLLGIASWYYIIIFCSVYESSTIGWIKGSLISLAIDYLGISVLIPLAMSTIREIVRYCPSLTCLLKMLMFFEWLRLLFKY